MKEIKVAKNPKIREIITDFLIDLPLFNGFSADELATITQQLNLIEMDKKEILFNEGDQGDYMCFIIEGSLDVIKYSGAGEYVLISELTKGRSIGEMSVIDDAPRSATIRARMRSKLLTLPRKDFDFLIRENPKLGIKILKRISRLLSLNLRKTSSRLADYMLPLC